MTRKPSFLETLRLFQLSQTSFAAISPDSENQFCLILDGRQVMSQVTEQEAIEELERQAGRIGAANARELNCNSEDMDILCTRWIAFSRTIRALIDPRQLGAILGQRTAHLHEEVSRRLVQDGYLKTHFGGYLILREPDDDALRDCNNASLSEFIRRWQARQERGEQVRDLSEMLPWGEPDAEGE